MNKDPQVNLRRLVIGLNGGCLTCGRVGHLVELSKEMRIAPLTLREFLVGSRRLNQSTTDLISLWVWNELNREAVNEEKGLSKISIINTNSCGV